MRTTDVGVGFRAAGSLVGQAFQDPAELGAFAVAQCQPVVRVLVMVHQVLLAPCSSYGYLVKAARTPSTEE
jgi:hypothetical protein